MNSTWDLVTLSYFSPKTWLNASYVYRFVGLLAAWRESSFLLQWGEAIGALLISLIFIFGPFITTGLIGVWLIAITGYWGILTLSDSKKPGFSPIHLFVFLYWGISAVAVALSPVKMAAFSGLVKLTLYLVFFVFSARILRSPRLTNWLITVVLGIGLVVGCYGIRQQIFGVEQLATWNDPTSELAGATRVYSYLGNPNLLSAYLLPSIALGVAAFFVWQGLLPKLLAISITLVNTACLYFTGSRGGWIGMVALVAAFLLLFFVWFKNNLSPFWRKWLLPLVFGILGGLMFAAIVSVDSLRVRVMSIFMGRGDSSNNFRINVWMAVLDMIRDRPLIGIGPGNEAFNQIYPLYMRPKYTALSAYSVFLETAVEIGLIGLSIFLGLIFTVFSCGLEQLKVMRSEQNLQGFWLIGAIAAIAGMLAHGLVDTVWYRPQINTIWWLMVAIIASSYPSLEQQK